MLPAVDAAVVSVLQQPSFEGSAIGVELAHGPKDVQEHLLDGLFRFPVIVKDCAGDPEDERAVPFK
jgi:hypothetical protein